MNSIDKLIRLANVRGTLDVRCQFQGNWTLAHEQEALGVAPYHIVLTGTCRVALANGQRLSLQAGDIVLLSGGASHVLSSREDAVAPVLPTRIPGSALPVQRIGNASTDLDMLCGGFHFNRASLLFSSLPDCLVIHSGALPEDGPLPALVRMLRKEADGDQIGAKFLLDALSQALFTLILRAHLATQAQGQHRGTLALISDKRLGRAWQAMLEDPAHEWDIEALAEKANMSRATFMRAFTRVAGVSPWTLLTQVRMELAFTLLSQSHLGLSDIAVQVGYQSQAAFSKKFKEVYGEAPGKVRRGL